MSIQVPAPVRNPSGRLSKHDLLKRYHRQSKDSLDQVVKEEEGYHGAVTIEFVKKRYIVAYPEAVAVYKDKTEGEPVSVYPLHRDCKISSVKKKKVTIQPPGKNMLITIVQNSNNQQQLWCFTVHAPRKAMWKMKETLHLGFSSQETAEQWSSMLKNQVVLTDPNASEMFSRLQSGIDWDDNPNIPAHRTRASTDELETGNSFDQDVDVIDEENFLDWAHESPAHTSMKWQPIQYINGVSVYQEEEREDGQGGSVMISNKISGSPKNVLKTVLQREDFLPAGLTHFQVLERKDSKSEIVKFRMNVGGFAGYIMSPRELVVQRNIRKESDGTYIVILSSVQHEAVPETEGVVRAHIEYAGYTISPLQQQYLGKLSPDESPECLVTLILKVNFGGWMSQQNWAYPYTFSWLPNFFVKRLVQLFIVLREQVENERFTVRPFSLTHDVGEQSSQWLRTSTMMVGKDRALTSTLTRAHSRSKRLPFHPVSDEQERDKESEQQGEKKPEILTMDMLDEKYWECPGSAGFKVRGLNYLVDKIKIPATEPVFELTAVDIISVEEPISHISRYLPYVQQSDAPFNFVINIVVPGKPLRHFVVMFSAEYNLDNVCSQDEENQDPDEQMSPFDMVLAKFLAGDGEEHDVTRNSRFKLIPHIVEGSWILRQSVGTTPVIIGKKLKTTYHRGPGYFEVCVDINSDSTARYITGLAVGATKSLVIDIAFLFEGHNSTELPEQLLGTVRVKNLNLGDARTIDTSKEIQPKRRKTVDS